MAIINEVPGVKITVQVDGQDAVEYDDPDGFENDANRKNARWRVFKYIESKDDAFFSIKYQVDNSHRWEGPDHAFALTLYVDGKRMDGVVCEATRFHNHDPFFVWNSTIEGSRDGSTALGYERLKRFRFSKVTTVDDAAKERVEVDVKNAKLLGVIEVFIQPMLITGPSRYTAFSHAVDTLNSFEIAEKALKGRAVSHGTSFVNSGVVTQRPTVTAEYLNNHNPIAAFSFKYRSRDALKEELIIPRSPSPEPIEGLSEAEIRRLAVERLNEINGDHRSPAVKREGKRSIIKREFTEFYDLTEEPVKREWKKVKIDGNRVAIDLTDD